MLSGHLLKLVLWSLEFPVLHVPGWIYFPDKRQTNLDYIFLWGADFCVLALSCFFGFVCFLLLLFLVMVAYLFIFRGLILAPDKLRTNSERALALSFCFSLELICFGVELFGFRSYKNTVITPCYQGNKKTASLSANQAA